MPAARRRVDLVATTGLAYQGAHDLLVEAEGLGARLDDQDLAMELLDGAPALPLGVHALAAGGGARTAGDRTSAPAQ